MSFSESGDKFIFTTFNGLIEVMDFDRCSGLFSNENVIDQSHPYIGYNGSTFSPDGQLLYVSANDTISNLYQFDLTAPNIFASRIVLASIAHPVYTSGALKLAPDGKIYWSCAWNIINYYNYPYQDTMYHTENMNLSVINDPDVVGTSCNFSLYSFNLGGKRTYWGLPNNPDYSLGPVAGSICDSLFNSVSEISKSNLEVYPNPFSDFISIESDEVNNIEISVIDQLGQQVYSGKLFSNTSKINLSYLKAGYYILICNTKSGKFEYPIIKLQ